MPLGTLGNPYFSGNSSAVTRPWSVWVWSVTEKTGPAPNSGRNRWQKGIITNWKYIIVSFRRKVPNEWFSFTMRCAVWPPGRCVLWSRRLVREGSGQRNTDFSKTSLSERHILSLAAVLLCECSRCFQKFQYQPWVNTSVSIVLLPFIRAAFSPRGTTPCISHAFPASDGPLLC